MRSCVKHSGGRAGGEAARWVTSAEVAAAAGVSRSAVSRAFTEGASVAPATRARVIAAAERLGYRPNALASGLNRRRSGIVGVVAAELANPFYARLLDALATRLAQAGYSPLLLMADEAAATDALIPRLLSYRVDGVIIACATLSSGMARAAADAATPVVLLDRRGRDGHAHEVASDNRAAGRLVAARLVAAGCRRLAFMAGIEATSTSRDREAGFRAGLAAAGLTLAARAVGHYRYEGGWSAAARLLAGRRPPDAVFCANDEMALATVDFARARDLDVPRDVAVVGFDAAAPASLGAYRLHTVAQDTDAMAARAVEALGLPRLPRRRFVVPSRLVEGTTVGPPR